jgi:SAM-dependent methyltransferase
VGLDASAGMLSVARHRATQRWPVDAAARFEWHAADAMAMPVPDASVDMVVSSFVMQLLPDRAAALAEALRVLRPGGIIGLVTWLVDDEPFLPDAGFDEAVYDLALADPGAAPGALQHDAADYASLTEAQAELEAVGFEAIRVVSDRLEHSWSRETYLVFKERFDEHELFDSLTAADRQRLLEQVRERWAPLPDEAFVLRAPLVAATARRQLEGRVRRLHAP